MSNFVAACDEKAFDAGRAGCDVVGLVPHTSSTPRSSVLVFALLVIRDVDATRLRLDRCDGAEPASTRMLSPVMNKVGLAPSTN